MSVKKRKPREEDVGGRPVLKLSSQTKNSKMKKSAVSTQLEAGRLYNLKQNLMV